VKAKETQGRFELLAPIGGLNARDSLRAMPETDAQALINFYPRTSDIITRRGYQQHCNSASGAIISTLAALIESDGTETLLAGTGTDLYDVTTATPALAASTTSDVFQWCEFGNELFLVNGVDACQKWDGSSAASVTWTGSGLTATDLVDVHPFKSRLWFAEKNSASAWYGGLRAKSGALTEFDLTGLMSGSLYLIATVSRQTGAGDTSQIVFFSTSGDVLVYDGDPASSLVLVGRAKTSRLLSRQSVASFGQDLLLLTESGVVALSSLLNSPSPFPITDKINKAILSDVATYRSLYGWQVLFYPTENQVLINVPTTTSTSKQYVTNLTSGAFAEYSGVHAKSWCMFEGKPHFGTSGGIVHTFDSGTSDNGNTIPYIYVSAPTFLGARGVKKRVSRIAPCISVESSTQAPVYEVGGVYSSESDSIEDTLSSGITPWGASWGDAWSVPYQVYDSWHSISTRDDGIVVKISGDSTSGRLAIDGIKFLYDLGNYL